MITGSSFSVILTLGVKGKELDFEVSGRYERGGSCPCCGFSDEPPWEDIQIAGVLCRGRPIGPNLEEYLNTNYNLSELVLDKVEWW